MATWKIIVNAFLILVILGSGILVILDYRKHKDDVSISPEELKELRRNNFRMALFLAIWLLSVHIERFFK